MVKNNTMKDPAEYLPLSQVMYHMLLCLTDGCELHGYGIKKEVKERTLGEIDLDPGTTYGYLKKMQKAGLIIDSGNREDEENNRRRYYKLSDLGQRVVRAEYQRVKDLEKYGSAKGVHLLKFQHDECTLGPSRLKKESAE